MEICTEHPMVHGEEHGTLLTIINTNTVPFLTPILEFSFLYNVIANCQNYV